MPELRIHPFLGTYTMVAANRQKRPHLPKDWCPFCPGSGKVPESYDVLLYPNDYPALSTSPEIITSHDFYEVKEAYGACEVVLYSSNHEAKLYELELSQITKIVKLWKEQFLFHKKDKKIQYIYPFENKGEEVGVTMPHPHGQIYAYSWLPLKIKTELENSRNFFQKTGKNLLQEVTNQELKEKSRVIFENDRFVAYIPFFTDYPYGVYVAPKINIENLSKFSSKDCESLAEVLKNITGAFDLLFDRPFPYMMVVHQTPVNNEEFAYSDNYYGFHIEFYPPLRAANQIKWYASSEMGAWAAANVKNVDETSEELRQALYRFLNQ